MTEEIIAMNDEASSKYIIQQDSRCYCIRLCHYWILRTREFSDQEMELNMKMSEILQHTHSSYHCIYPPFTEDHNGFRNNLITKSYKVQRLNSSW